MTQENFTDLMTLVYLNKKSYVKRIPRLFSLLDENQSG